MFRARKPSFKRSQPDETPRKRARLASAAVKDAPLMTSIPVSKTPLDVKKKGSLAKPSTKLKAKTQSRIRFPIAKDRQSKAVGATSEAEKSSLELGIESKEVNGQTPASGSLHATHSTQVKNVLTTALSQNALAAPASLGTAVKHTDTSEPDASFSPWKKLDFGVDSALDTANSVSTSAPTAGTSDTQEQGPGAVFWPPYEPSDEVLCRAHDHRLIKPEDDPILEAALELLL